MNEITTLKDRNLSKISNELIYYSYKLSSISQDIIQIILAQITEEDTAFNRYTISVKEIEKKIGARLRDNMFDRIAEELFKPVFAVKNENGQTVNYSWCSEFTRPNEANKTITIEIHKVLNKHLLQLKQNKTAFTIIDTKYFLQLKGLYSKRLYQILRNKIDIAKLQKKSAYYTVNIEELINILKAPKSFKNYVNLKNRVLIKAQKEINESTDLDIKFEEQKRGNKVVSIKFLIQEKAEVTAAKAKKIEEKENRIFERNTTKKSKALDNIEDWLAKTEIETVEESLVALQDPNTFEAEIIK